MKALTLALTLVLCAAPAGAWECKPNDDTAMRCVSRTGETAMVYELKGRRLLVTADGRRVDMGPIDPKAAAAERAAAQARQSAGRTVIQPLGDSLVIRRPDGSRTVCNPLGESLVCH